MMIERRQRMQPDNAEQDVGDERVDMPVLPASAREAPTIGGIVTIA